MKKIHISFGDEKYYGSLKALERSSLKNGTDIFEKYEKNNLLGDPFWKNNIEILSQPRGAGYWLWKPYIISKTINKLDEGDIVLYTDAAVLVISSLQPLFNLITEERGIIVFEQGTPIHTNKIWTKRDTFRLMDCDEEKYWNDVQLTATFSLWRADQKSVNFLSEWQKYMENPRISTDIPCKENFKEFKDHRHDQSVLSIMSQKYNLERFRDPSQWGNDDKTKTNSPYGQIFNHHRMKLFG